MKATLFTDGGARGNPGPAGIGYVLTLENGSTIEKNAYIGEATNNQSEYKALVAGLELAKSEGVTELSCFLDSELVVKQMQGKYKVKNADLKLLLDRARAIAVGIGEVSYGHVRREKNKIADRLVNEAIDAKSNRIE